MRVGVDASNIRGGGGVTHLIELMAAASPEQHGIEYIYIWGSQTTLSKFHKKPWLETIHVPMLDKSLFFRQYWQRIVFPKEVQGCCDVVLAPGGAFSNITMPVVTICQNMLLFESEERQRYGLSAMRLKLKLLMYSQTRSFRKANGVIFLTYYAQKKVEQEIGALTANTAVVYHGISENFRQTPRPQHSIQLYSFEKPFRLLYVSIITVYKHQWHVAEAVAILRKAGIPIVLDLVGSAYPPALKRLQNTLQHIDPTGSFITYRGNIDYGRLAEEYHKADAFIFASSCENLPIILLEAMAASLPIACSNRGPMAEVLGDAGIYFDPEQVNSIVDALHLLLSDVALRERCIWEAHRLAQSYTWEHCAEQTLDFIAKTTSLVCS